MPLIVRISLSRSHRPSPWELSRVELPRSQSAAGALCPQGECSGPAGPASALPVPRLLVQSYSEGTKDRNRSLSSAREARPHGPLLTPFSYPLSEITCAKSDSATDSCSSSLFAPAGQKVTLIAGPRPRLLQWAEHRHWAHGCHARPLLPGFQFAWGKSLPSPPLLYIYFLLASFIPTRIQNVGQKHGWCGKADGKGGTPAGEIKAGKMGQPREALTAKADGCPHAHSVLSFLQEGSVANDSFASPTR